MAKDNNWQELNDITNYVSNHRSQNKKHFRLVIVMVLSSLLLILSLFSMAVMMKNAFNYNAFITKPPTESIVVNMEEVPIYDSKESLRLNYFKTTTKTQVFNLAIQNSYWDSFLPIDISSYDFAYYDSNTTTNISNELVQKDAFVNFDLLIKLKNSFFKIRIPVIAQIKNTNSFYEKFMIFNHFESGFSVHINGQSNVTENYLPEQREHGYVPATFAYQHVITNEDAYNTISDSIKRFMTDYQQEFSANTRIFPVITTIPLNNIDINDDDSFESYIKLILEPQKYYIGNALPGNSKEYVNLVEHGSISLNSRFYIAYVYNDNIVNELIALKDKTVEEIINFFKAYPPDYFPFSMVQQGVDANDQFVNYVPAHNLKLAEADFPIYIKYRELGAFLGNVLSLNNGVETINRQDANTIGQLKTLLNNKYWKQIYDIILANKIFFSLSYPHNDPVSTTKNWEIATKSLAALQSYLQIALGVSKSDLTSFTFYDAEHNKVVVTDNDVIANNKITNFSFHIGQDLKTNAEYEKPHSFNYFFQLRVN